MTSHQVSCKETPGEPAGVDSAPIWSYACTHQRLETKHNLQHRLIKSRLEFISSLGVMRSDVCMLKVEHNEPSVILTLCLQTALTDGRIRSSVLADWPLTEHFVVFLFCLIVSVPLRGAKLRMKLNRAGKKVLEA